MGTIMNRRQFFKTGSTALALTGLAGAILPGRSGIIGTANAKETSKTHLPIPELLENNDKSGKTATFSMSTKQGTVEFFKEKPTQTMGYNGSFLGPTIRVRNGQPFRLSLTNNLSETTTLHWHGLHVPAKWDGGPRQPIAPKTVWKPDFKIAQQAATLWYHPHAMGSTGKQVYNGLAGLFYIDDEISDNLDIPKTYGIDDIPLIIQDRRFFKTGQFAYVQSMHDVINGVIGNYLLVNGAIQPISEVHSGLVRLRILNGSNSSIYRIAFDQELPFQVIASDGGFLERPVKMNSIVLSAGERAEVLVDFSILALGRHVNLMVDQIGGRRFEAMKFLLSHSPDRNKTIPKIFRKIDKIPESKSIKTRRFEMRTMSGMGMMGKRLTINGKQMDINRIDEKIKVNSIEIWEIVNSSGMMMSMPHSMHLHDVQFQILSRNGKTPPLHEKGRKDTVLILPGESVKIIIHFKDYKGIYMYHCHLLEHEDDGMMGQFEII
jgi:blue copper oxidase